MSQPTYYRNTDEWKTRVHILPDADTWRSDWPHHWRDDLIITPGGLFIVRREDDYAFARPATVQDARNFFGPAAVGARRVGGLQLVTRIPFSLLRVAVAFFTAIWHSQQREDVLLLYRHDSEQRYVLVHPNVRSAGQHHVDYEVPVTPTGQTRFGSLHSHGQAPAYHSGDDLKDDLASPGLHVIVGSLDSMAPTLDCIFSDGRYCLRIAPDDVFVSDESAATFPASWVQVQVPCGRAPQPTN